MISSSVLENAELYRARFQDARPFKHLCIDNFFQADAVEALLRDFPRFDKENARNEFGEYGGKAVVSNIRTISGYYAHVYDYLFSPAFLQAMTAITGIPDLYGDPTLYGGGTHENLNGQELDTHVDFNFQIAGGFHRRANLLLYLNEEWDPAWGGAIELHSNPRNPDTNEMVEYNVTFNRAVVFETNEYSWHGFRKIKLPADRRNLSRKCLSIYLYTKDRPADEIAGPHGTFYVQRPLSTQFNSGHVLSAADVDEIKSGYARRDRQIEMYQKLEEKLGRQIEDMKRHLDQVQSAIKAPIIGWARQVGNVAGLYHDNWANLEMSVKLRCERPVTSLSIEGYIPEKSTVRTRRFQLTIDGAILGFSVQKNGTFAFYSSVNYDAGADLELSIKCDTRYTEIDQAVGGDARELSYILTAITLF